MKFSKSLYYPESRQEENPFLKNACLFWDEINIVASKRPVTFGYEQNIMENLYHEGIINAIKIDEDDEIIKSLDPYIHKYIDTFGIPGPASGRVFYAYPGRFSKEIQKRLFYCLTRGGVFIVTPEFGNFYMTLLANKICSEYSLALATENKSVDEISNKLRVIQSHANDSNDINEKFFSNLSLNNNSHLKQGLFTNCVINGIKVSDETSITEIVKFRNKYRDELGLFRGNMHKLTESINTDLSLEALKEQINNVYNDDFIPAFNNFKKALQGSRIKFITDNFLKISMVSTGATALPMALVGLSMQTALLTSAVITMITSSISYNQERQNLLRNNPYSYLLNLEKKL